MNAVSVKDVNKKFKVYYDKGQSMKERILFRNRSHYEDRWVLKNISFDVKKGEAIGLIGENGCGKSTLLKLLSKIMYPDNGSIKIEGRVSSLIELGAGFHPDMSGRENIYTNASIFGLNKKEIDKRLEKIIEFSELEEFIDNPVRTYSSGMYMRLAFAVAINVDADVLLIDEILAVGDASFQSKCFNKLREIKVSGTTIIIVSHSLGQIEQICERSIWIDNGVIRKEGTPRMVHPQYMEFMGQKRFKNLKKEEPVAQEESKAEQKEEIQKTSEESIDDIHTAKRFGSNEVIITDTYIVDSQGTKRNVFSTGEKVEIVIEYKLKKSIESAAFGVGIIRNDGVYAYGTNTLIDNMDWFGINKDGTASFIIEKLLLMPGIYDVDIAINDTKNMEFAVDYIRKAFSFEMYSSVSDLGVARIEHEWKINP